MDSAWRGCEVEREGAVTAGGIPKWPVVGHVGCDYRRYYFPVLNSAAERMPHAGLVMEKKRPCSGYVFCQHDILPICVLVQHFCFVGRWKALILFIWVFLS